MTEQPIAEFVKMRPCASGCTRTDGDGIEHNRLATHGGYCDRCYYSTDGTLRRASNLVGYMVTQIAGIQSRVDDGSKQTKKHPPLPMNVEAFNDANSVYAALVYWTSLWATRLKRQAPGPAARAWRRDDSSVVGLPNDITFDDARYAVSIMATWLSAHLDDIYATVVRDDIDYFRIAVEEEIYRLLAKWPIEDRAEYVPVKCWVQVDGEECGAKIAVWPPRFADDERKIKCDAGHRFEEDKFDQMSKVFRQVRAEQAKESVKLQRRAARLAEKYSAA